MNISTMRALSPAEQEFAGDNHKLVYTYLHKRCLSIDNYYDVVIFGYLRAVTKYHDRKDLQKFSFSTIAWRCMDTAYSNHHKLAAGKANMINANALRLDAPLDSLGGYTLGDAISSVREVYSRLEYVEFLREMVSSLPHMQRKTVLMRLDGCGKREIAKALKASV